MKVSWSIEMPRETSLYIYINVNAFMFQIFMMSACQSFPDYPPAAPLAAPSGSSTSTSSTMYTSTQVPTCSVSIAGNATSATVFPGAAATSTISGPCQTAPPMIASPPRAPAVATARVAFGRGTPVISPIGATPRPATTTTLTIPQPAMRMPPPVRNSSFNFLDSINPMRAYNNTMRFYARCQQSQGCFYGLCGQTVPSCQRE